MDAGIPAFSITLFVQKKVTSLLASAWLCRKIFLFCRTDSFDGLNCLFFRNHESPIFFFVCLQMVAFEYFQYYLIFDRSDKIYPMELFVNI